MKNLGRARVLGLELDARRPLGKHLSLQTNLTLQDAISLESSLGTGRKQLPGEARISAYGRLEYLRGRWLTWLEGDLKRDRFYDSPNLRPAEDASTVNAGARWRNTHWQFELAINNLGDRNIEDFSGFPRPGRAAFLTLKRQF